MESFVPLNATESPLTPKECEAAVSELYNGKPFRIANRRLVDPMKPGEPRFMLFSFTKAEGATPDKDGFMGVAKIRGAFFTEQEAAIRAEEIIRDVDSSNCVNTAIAGMPFPLVAKGYALEETEIDLSKKTEKVISDNVRAKRKADEKEIREIEERRAALLNDDGSIKESESPEDVYIQQRVKLAHLRYAISEHISKLKECRDLEMKVRTHLRECRLQHPEYEDDFIKRYQEGRRKVGIPADTDFSGFMKYFSDPIDPEVENHISVFCEKCTA